MKTVIVAAARTVLCALLLFSLAPSAAARQQRFRGKREARPYTQRLPPVDKVELLKLEKREMWAEGDGVEATKTLEGAEARRVASLWRTQYYTPAAAICHYPPFAIKFYSKDRLLAYASLCWECDNISFITPRLGDRQGFVGGSRQGKALLRLFRDAF